MRMLGNCWVDRTRRTLVNCIWVSVLLSQLFNGFVIVIIMDTAYCASGYVHVQIVAMGSACVQEYCTFSSHFSSSASYIIILLPCFVLVVPDG